MLVPPENSASETEIADLLRTYFEGLYHADSTILARVFHPDARYVNAVKGDYMNYSRSEYFEIVDGRMSPAGRNDPRKERIVLMEFGGEGMAFVKAEMSMMGREYLDFLTLTFEDGCWRIMSKIFTYSPMKEEI